MRHKIHFYFAISTILSAGLCTFSCSGSQATIANASQEFIYSEADESYWDDEGIHFHDAEDVPALHKACNSSHIDVDLIRKLVADGEDINQEYRFGKRYNENLKVTPLGVACYRKDIDENAIRVLVELGAKIDQYNTYISQTTYGNRRFTPLIAACDRSEIDDEAVKTLLELGADINAKAENGDSAIMVAADRDHFDTKVVEMLMDSGANLNFEAMNGTRLLSTLVQDERLTAKAIYMGAATNFIDKEDTNLLHIAALCGSIGTVSLLLQNGQDVNHVNAYGNTPMMGALLGNKLDVVKAIHEAGGNLSEKNKDLTSLMFACYPKYPMNAVQTPQLDVVEYLLKNGADIRDEDNGGWTALEYAANNKTDASEVIAYLIKKGAKVNHLTKSEQSPLLLARHPNNARILLKKGAKIQQVDNKGNTALHLALQNRAFDVVPVLIDAGINVNQLNNDTDYHCIKANNPMTEAICAKGDTGVPAIYYAWNPQMIHYLVSHGAKINPANTMSPVSYFWYKSDSYNAFDKSNPDTKLSPEQKGSILLAYLREGAKLDSLSPSLHQIEIALQQRDIWLKSEAERKELLSYFLDDNTLPATDDDNRALMEAVLGNGIYKGVSLNQEEKFDQLVKQGVPVPDNAISLYMKYAEKCNYQEYCQKEQLRKIIQAGGKRILNRSDEFSINNSKSENTPVLFAITVLTPKFLSTALHEGANPNVQFNKAYRLETPNIYRPKGPHACQCPRRNGRILGCQLSYECKPDMTLFIQGMTPLMVVANRPEDVQSLIDAGADVNLGDLNGITPLMLAVIYSNADSVKRLIKAGANVNAVSREFGSVLNIAIQNEDQNIIKILKNNGATSTEGKGSSSSGSKSLQIQIVDF